MVGTHPPTIYSRKTQREIEKKEKKKKEEREMCLSSILSLNVRPFSSSSSFYNSSSLLKLPLIISHRPTRRRVDVTAAVNGGNKEKILVIMGATGCGKSGLSVKLASHFSGEIINSDKIQVYTGLDITTNKIPLHERHDVPHHILGDVDSDKGDFTPLDFRIRADSVVSDIASRQKLPILVGGSNSFIHAMLVRDYDSNDDVFNHNVHIPKFISSDLRYNCCFLWLDVGFPILAEYLSVRVDDMLGLGMFEELAEFYDPSVAETTPYRGIRRAIGMPEFDKYFVKRAAFGEAVDEIKVNTHVLARRQIGKILKLKRAGWDINVLNATEGIRAVLEPGTRLNREEIWRKQVWEPSLRIVNRFLEE